MVTNGCKREELMMLHQKGYIISNKSTVQESALKSWYLWHQAQINEWPSGIEKL